MFLKEREQNKLEKGRQRKILKIKKKKNLQKKKKRQKKVKIVKEKDIYRKNCPNFPSFSLLAAATHLHSLSYLSQSHYLPGWSLIAQMKPEEGEEMRVIEIWQNHSLHRLLALLHMEQQSAPIKTKKCWQCRWLCLSEMPMVALDFQRQNKESGWNLQRKKGF